MKKILEKKGDTQEINLEFAINDNIQAMTPEMYVNQHCKNGVMLLNEFEKKWLEIIDETHNG